jgi:glycosyltransferase involved in cell wall biosynthesis
VSGISSPRNRVLLPFVGDRVGGSHISALLLANTLRRSDYDPVIVVHREGALTDHLRMRGLAYMTAPPGNLVGEDTSALGYASALGSSVSRLSAFLRTSQFPILHTNDLRMHMTWALPARLAGVRHLWHQRTTFPGSRSTRLAARLASRFACISQYCLESLPEPCQRRAQVVMNPVETTHAIDRAAARGALLSECGIAADARILLFVGNLQQQKRPLVFLEAAARIMAALAVPAAFVMLGGDKEGLLPEVRRRAEALGISAMLHILGYRHPPEPWIAAADVLLAPQVGEGFGRTLVEAMQVGTPVVAARSGGHREIIADETVGVLVTLDDPVAMANAAVRILRSREGAAEIAAAARKHVAERFAPSAHARDVVSLYQTLLQDGASAAA